MGHIGAVSAGVALGEVVFILIGFDPNAALFDGQKLARAFEMGLTAQGTARAETDLVKLDVLLQIDRRERADLALLITAVNLRAIAGTDDLDFGCAGLCALDELLQGEPKSTRDAKSHGERRIGFFTLDLAEHRATHATGCCQILERPTTITPQLLHPLA